MLAENEIKRYLRLRSPLESALIDYVESHGRQVRVSCRISEAYAAYEITIRRHCPTCGMMYVLRCVLNLPPDASLTNWHSQVRYLLDNATRTLSNTVCRPCEAKPMVDMT